MIFKNTKHESLFEKDGFFTVPFLNESEVDMLKKLYDSLDIERLHSIYSNIQDKEQNINEEIDRLIVETFQSKIDDYFTDYKLGGGVFLVKGTGEASASTIHQDWNVVDENKYISLNIWCPLVDVDEQNGCLQVLPRSHNWFKTIRSFNIDSVYLEFKDVQKCLKSVPVKKGTAVIYAHNLFHGSKPNYTTIIRPAVVVGLVPKKATMIHYLRNDDVIDVVNAENDFFNKIIKKMYQKKNPNLDIVESIAYKKPVSKTEILKKLSANKWWSIFKYIKKNANFT